jgi:hypothetical protein
MNIDPLERSGGALCSHVSTEVVTLHTLGFLTMHLWARDVYRYFVQSTSSDGSIVYVAQLEDGLTTRPTKCYYDDRADAEAVAERARCQYPSLVVGYDIE